MQSDTAVYKVAALQLVAMLPPLNAISFFESAAVSGLLVPLLIQCPAVSNPPPSTPPPLPPPHPSPPLPPPFTVSASHLCLSVPFL